MKSSKDGGVNAVSPEVAVIIPCRDVGEYLTETVESVLAQMREADPVELEVIVVDDGSTDPRTCELLAELNGRESVSVIRNEGRPGISDARNTGVRRSSARWVAYLDGDDLLLPGALRKRLQVLERYPQARWIGTDFQDLSPDGTIDETRNLAKGREAAAVLSEIDGAGGEPVRIGNTLATFVRVSLARVGAVMVRRDLHEEVGGFDPAIGRWQDQHMWLRLAAVEAYYFLPVSTFLYRYRPGSVSNSGYPRGDGGLAVYDDLVRKGILSRTWPRVRRRLHGFHMQNVHHHRRHGDFRRGLHDALGAVISVPWSMPAWKGVAACVLKRR